MTRRFSAGPTVRRMVPLRRFVQEPPADPWTDTAIVAWSIVILVGLIVISAWIPFPPPVVAR